MGAGDNFMIKPGTMFLFVLIAAFGLAMFSWASSSLEDAKSESLGDQDDAFKCSGLDIKVEQLKSGNDTVEVWFSVNKDVDRVYVSFEGSSNVTKTISDVEQHSINSVDASMKNFSRVSFNVDECDNIFTAE